MTHEIKCGYCDYVVKGELKYRQYLLEQMREHKLTTHGGIVFFKDHPVQAKCLANTGLTIWLTILLGTAIFVVAGGLAGGLLYLLRVA